LHWLNIYPCLLFLFYVVIEGGWCEWDAAPLSEDATVLCFYRCLGQ